MFYQADLVNEMDGLRKFAFKLTRSASDADDLVQSTVLRALEKKHLFKEDSNLFAWTSKIMYNLFVSAYRRKTKFETQYDPEDYIKKQSIDANQDVKIELKNVKRAMQTLSKDHREVLIMVCVQGMSYAEVAKTLNIPVGTVRSRLFRARETLQSMMDTSNITSLNVAANDTQDNACKLVA